MIEHQRFRSPAPGQPLILAAFSYRYDAHLVPDLIENIRPGVHGLVAWDDRHATAALSDEPARRGQLLAAARDLGADWLLTPDPDERFEQGIADWLPALAAESRHILWTFPLREMFSPDQYRSDGLWQAKSVLRLFPVDAATPGPNQALHGSWAEAGPGTLTRTAPVNLYHLRMASPRRRALRRDTYAAADPERRFQPLGYDYLADERGMVLTSLPPERGFVPPFVEDHGFWAPDPGSLGAVGPDPYEVRLARAARSARRQGQLAAHQVMLDLGRDSPGDGDLRLFAARFALEAGAFGPALALADQALADRPGDLYPRLLRVCCHLATDPALAGPDLARLSAWLPDSPVIAALRTTMDRPTTGFAAPDADWRRLAPADAQIAEGRAVARSDLATAVIGFRNQPGLLPAIQSLLDQDAATEIVVVNTGGGAVARALAPVAGQVRLITCNAPLLVGAARNIGVAASRAPFIAFLAGDCLARPGWVSGRLARHRAGALSVSTAVAGHDDAGLVAGAAARMRFATRHPLADPGRVQHYGQSYARRLLDLCGIFPPGLAAGEDTALNRFAARFAAPVWAPEVVTLHRDPTDLATLLRDERRRGVQRAAHASFRVHAGPAGSGLVLAWHLRRRIIEASALLAREPGLSDVERRALLATGWLAVQAEGRGLAEGLGRIAAATTLADRARALAAAPDRALPLARAACEADPGDPDKASLLAQLCLALGDTDGAERALRIALALDPGASAAALQLTRLVATRDGPAAALALAERLALAAPTRRQLWEIAADLALAAGLRDWAVALGQVALGCAVGAASGHARLARLHGQAGNPQAQAFRARTASRLSARAAWIDKAGG